MMETLAPTSAMGMRREAVPFKVQPSVAGIRNLLWRDNRTGSSSMKEGERSASSEELKAMGSSTADPARTTGVGLTTGDTDDAWAN